MPDARSFPCLHFKVGSRLRVEVGNGGWEWGWVEVGVNDKQPRDKYPGDLNLSYIKSLLA